MAAALTARECVVMSSFLRDLSWASGQAFREGKRPDVRQFMFAWAELHSGLPRNPRRLRRAT